MTVDNSLTQISREALLNASGSFSVSQLQELTLGEQDPSTGGRRHMLESQRTRVRLIPLELYSAAEVLINEGFCVRGVGVIKGGFDHYRQCTARGFFAPLVPSRGVWEWPKPEGFEWSELDSYSGFVANLTGGLTVSEPYLNLGEVARFYISRLRDVRFAMADELQNLCLRQFGKDLRVLLEGVQQGAYGAGESKELLRRIKGSVNLSLFRLT